MDLAVGVFNGLDHGGLGRLVGQLVVGMLHGIDGHLARLLAGRVGPHAVGHHEQMAPALEFVAVAGQPACQGVLIVGAPQAQIGNLNVLQAIVPVPGVLLHSIWRRQGDLRP